MAWRKAVQVATMSILLLGIGSVTTPVVRADQTTQQAFIAKLQSPVVTVANQYQLFPSVMMAQAALESAWGTSQLTVQANNYFGIKGSYNGQSVTMPTAEYDDNGQLYYTDAAFRKYPNAEASLTDNAQLLRNGTSYNPQLYAGTWRQGTNTYVTAANALTGTYATAPTYGASLIAVIQQYGLDQLLDTQTTPAPKPKPDPAPTTSLDKVTYYGASGNERGQLASQFSKYKLYRHIKNTRTTDETTAWTKVKAKAGQTVYLDMRGVKDNKSKTTWYRIRFDAKTSATKYWVTSAAMTMPKVTYQTGTMKVAISNKTADLRNHVFNSAYLSKVLGTTAQLKNTQYTVDNQATIAIFGQKQVWNRLINGKTKQWVISTAVTPRFDAVSYKKSSGTRHLSKTFKKYYLYNHVKNTRFDQTTTAWPKTAKAGTAVTIDLIGTKTVQKTIWYRISFDHHQKYWVTSQALTK